VVLTYVSALRTYMYSRCFNLNLETDDGESRNIELFQILNAAMFYLLCL